MDLFGLIQIPNWLIIICILLGLFYIYFTWNHGFWEAQNVPAIKSYSILRSYLSEPISEQDVKNAKKYGKVYGIYEGRKPYLMINDLDMIKTILIKDFNYFVDRREMPFGKTAKITKQFLSNLRGDEWRSARYVLSPIFTTGKLRQMSELMINSSDKMVQAFHKDIKEHKGILNMKDRFGAFTMDVIASCCFSYNLNSQNSKDPFIEHANLLFNQNFTIVMISMMLFPKLADYVDVSFFPIKCIEYFESVVHKVVSLRRKENIRRTDFLQLLLDAQDAEKKGKVLETAENSQPDDEEPMMTMKPDTKIWKNNKVLDEPGLVASCILFLLAGFDTIANTICFATYLLALNPDCQQKLQEEIDEAFETHGKLSHEIVMSMSYLEKAFSETLRIYPPSFRLERTCNRDYQLGDITIPKDMVVAAGVYSIHHDPEIYPDSEVFDPERFSPENKAKRHPMAYLPFGAGPRICIGMRFALMEAKLALAHFFKEFTVSPCSKTEIPLKMRKGIPFLMPVNGVCLQVKARN